MSSTLETRWFGQPNYYADNDSQVDKNNDDKKSNEKVNCIRLICISDTHCMHRQLTKKLESLYKSPNDILLHAGDFSEGGTKEEILDVDEWFGELPYKHIYVISGNMDGLTLETQLCGDQYFSHAKYLEHESITTKIPALKDNQLTIFGSPYTPKFYGGFQIPNDKKGKKLWQQIPTNTDILMVHGPPKNIMDQTSRGWSVGDSQLRNEVLNRVKPKVMIFGHVHPSHGRSFDKQNGTIFANVAMHDNLKGMENAKEHEPIVIEIPINHQ